MAGLAVVLVAAGCSSPAKPSAQCEAVSLTRAQSILGDSSGVTATKAGAVKSTEHSDAYYVAIRFTGPGISKDGEVGVWASAGGAETGTVVSVDGFAERFSGLPKHDSFSVTDAGASEAKTCV